MQPGSSGSAKSSQHALLPALTHACSAHSRCCLQVAEAADEPDGLYRWHVTLGGFAPTSHLAEVSFRSCCCLKAAAWWLATGTLLPWSAGGLPFSDCARADDLAPLSFTTAPGAPPHPHPPVPATGHAAGGTPLRQQLCAAAAGVQAPAAPFLPALCPAGQPALQGPHPRVGGCLYLPVCVACRSVCWLPTTAKEWLLAAAFYWFGERAGPPAEHPLLGGCLASTAIGLAHGSLMLFGFSPSAPMPAVPWPPTRCSA